MCETPIWSLVEWFGRSGIAAAAAAATAPPGCNGSGAVLRWGRAPRIFFFFLEIGDIYYKLKKKTDYKLNEQGHRFLKVYIPHLTKTHTKKTKITAQSLQDPSGRPRHQRLEQPSAA
jgi:hypothetical protein